MGRGPCRAARGDLPGAQGHSRAWTKQRVNNATRLSFQRATRLFASPFQVEPPHPATLDARRRMQRVPSLSPFAYFARSSSTPPRASAPTRSPFLPLQLCSLFGATDAKCRHMTRSLPPGSFSRSQSWASQARSDATADYVEDSEPEREERRIQAAKTRGVKRKKTPVLVVPNLPGDVIELTDSSPSRPTSPAHRLTNVQSAPLVIIDVSGEPQPQ